MEITETRGLVLYNRNYREDDKLVKIFTETSGKRMFFVKHAGKSKLASVIQPLTSAVFLTKLNDSGLSYIDDYHESSFYKRINTDLFCFSYATYVVSLADAAIIDNSPDSPLFSFLVKTLDLMNDGLDYEVLTNIFEVQILERFGVQLNFHECVFCHRVGQRFDFSYRHSGLLCPDHYDEDINRSHIDPNVLYLLDKFQSIQFDELTTISVKTEMKVKLRHFLDGIYENYVGIQLKSKKFIDGLHQWGSLMKSDKEN